MLAKTGYVIRSLLIGVLKAQTNKGTAVKNLTTIRGAAEQREVSPKIRVWMDRLQLAGASPVHQTIKDQLLQSRSLIGKLVDQFNCRIFSNPPFSSAAPPILERRPVAKHNQRSRRSSTYLPNAPLPKRTRTL